jgi:regulator of replication initiation timing
LNRYVDMMKRILYIAIGMALLGSCVPTGKFTQQVDKSNSLQGERDVLMAENEFLTVENREMRAMFDEVEAQKEQFTKDSIRIYKRVEDLEMEIAQLERKYVDLESTHEALLRGNARETRRLLN